MKKSVLVLAATSRSFPRCRMVSMTQNDFVPGLTVVELGPFEAEIADLFKTLEATFREPAW